ncbi:MAG: DUF2798 domain-containing protein [Pseudomonadota bacterium]
MKPFLPKRLEHYAFGLLLSGMMSFLVSGLSTFLALGRVDFAEWVAAWLSSWAIAFPAVLIVAPFVRKILAKIVLPAPTS